MKNKNNKTNGDVLKELAESKYTPYAKINSPSISLEEYLDIEMNTFFPDTGHWYSTCFKRPNEYNIDNLPCHLDDDKWLANFIIYRYNLINAKFKDVLDYVRNSKKFIENKKQYALEIVKWQINWIKNGGENWICDSDLGGDICRMTPVWDLAFRKGVVDTLLAIGMNKEIIEEGLEENSDMWFESVIDDTFDNQFNPLILNLFGTKKITEYPPVNPEFKKAWILKRKYDYYCDHKRSVDLYGKKSSVIEIERDDLIKLENFIKTESVNRMEEINKVNEINGEHQVECLENSIENNAKPLVKKKLLGIFSKKKLDDLY